VDVTLGVPPAQEILIDALDSAAVDLAALVLNDDL